MRNIRYLLAVLLLLGVTMTLRAQVVIGNDQEYDIDYLTPKTYEIGGITVEGGEHLDQRMILLVSGLQVGDIVKVPGDKISTAVDNLWEQGLFEDVQIQLTRIQDNRVFLNILLKERPRLLMYRLSGIKKNDTKKVKEQLSLRAGDVVTENLIKSSTNKIRSYYAEKGYTDVEVQTSTVLDTSDENHRVVLHFKINPGKRVKIERLIIEGNNEERYTAPLAENVPILKHINVQKKSPTRDNKLKRKMKNTHDVHYAKQLYFWTPGFWKRSKYREAAFQEDQEAIISYYNELGYRDARITFDTVWPVDSASLDISAKKRARQNRVNVKMNIYEGHRFYFRNITFTGNTIYPTETLASHLRIKKGDPYNKTILETNLNYNPSGTDIYSMYMDNGYLFFNATPVEVAVENDSIDIEIRLVEGKQARVRNVSVQGNTVTNDKVLMRELHTRPGDLFSRDALLRSRRELLTLGYFDESSLIPEPHPNVNDGTVDIVYKVTEKTTSQLQLQGGYGSGMFYGQLSVQLTNFSARNIFNKKAWNPLPAGDGQQLGVSVASNGPDYYAIGLNFTEPWLGGHRPQSLGVSLHHNKYSNGYYARRYTSVNYYSLTMSGATVSLTRRLKWPDNYFILSQALGYKHYGLENYHLNNIFTDGNANEISYSIGLTRNSLDAPIYPRSGSEVSIMGYITPPYSLFSDKDFANAETAEKYKWLEYFKINVKGSWMLNVVGDLVFNARFRFGFMGYYNKDIGLSPFGRYYLGGDGLQSYVLDGSEIIPLRGYTSRALSPDNGAAIFDRYTLELRHPIIESPGTTIYALGFLEGGNSWATLREFQPFKLYNAAGVGVRLYLPMMGLLGFDWGYGFDGSNGGSQFHFIIGQSIE